MVLLAGCAEPVTVLTDLEVRTALNRVTDPCSRTAGEPVGLVDMGLVTRVEVEASRVEVGLCVTGPGCTYVGLLATGAAAAVRELAGVEDVVVELDPAVVWSESRMSAGARDRLARRRRRTVVDLGVRPQMWREA